MELQNVGVDPQPAAELATVAPAAGTTTSSAAAGGWGCSGSSGGWGIPPRLDAVAGAGTPAILPGQKQLGLGRPMPGLMPTTPQMLGLGQSPHLLTGAALAQQQGKTQICFNYTGGRCFRDNCRFLHLGPGGRAPPQPALFTGILPQ